MATPHFGIKLKSDLDSALDTLLGRPIAAYPCPLTPVEQAGLWLGFLPDHLQAAYKVFKDEHLYTNSLEDANQEFCLNVGGKLFDIHLRTQPFKSLNAPIEWVEDHCVRNSQYLRLLVDGGKIASLIPSSADAFFDWVRNRAAIATEFTEALATLRCVLEMVTTVGQLRRMIPDVIEYLPEDKQRIIREQQRASSLPAQWAVFDRAAVHRATCALAKAHLMPPDKANQLQWSMRWHHTGAHEWVYS